MGGVHLRQLVQVSVHRALQQAPPQPADRRVARHAEHGVGAGVGDGGSEVGHADDEAVPERGSALARRRRERRDKRAQLPPEDPCREFEGKTR